MSTPNHYYDVSHPPPYGHTGNGNGITSSLSSPNDEYSYSCTSTQWTQTSCSKNHMNSGGRVVPMMPLEQAGGGNGATNATGKNGRKTPFSSQESRDGSEEHGDHRGSGSDDCGNGDDMDGKKGEEEEKDGFVQLITERQRSRLVRSFVLVILLFFG